MNSIALLVHNIGYIFSIALLIALSILIYIQDHKKLVNRMLLLAFGAVFVFLVSHLIGVSISDPHLSKLVLMFNLTNIFISCFLMHFVLLFLGKAKEQKIPIIIAYALSAILFVVYLIFPDTFLLDSAPKLYFTNYYVAGDLHWIMRLLSNALIPAYFLVYMLKEYPKQDAIMQNRLRYLLFGIFFGYSLGAAAIPLVFTSTPVFFGILIDPVYSIFFVPFFIIPFTYAVLKYELLDIRIVAKRAFVYAVTVAGVGVLITLLNFSNDIARSEFPGFPTWLIPFVSSVIAVSVSFMVWRKLRESDVLKYEFITVVTHKFRTPLTQIRWAAEELAPEVPETGKQSMNQIKNANFRLIELTNLLVRLSDTDSTDFEYLSKPFALNTLVSDNLAEYVERAALKTISVTFNDGGISTLVAGDESKIKFVLQILLDNAVNYNHPGGKVDVLLKEDKGGKALILSVTDTGIGLSKEEAGRLFQKFWRSLSALKADTEGMGIGLFMARRIVEREGGQLWAESAGAGKGSTFYLKMPVA